jgi:cytoskeletal protein RodZ
VSIGETLAEARRQAGLTVTEVSQRTRIRESIIRGIEQGDFSACGGDFYARGHIRGIASAIGIDPVPLVKEYDADHGPPGGISAAEVFEPSTPIRIRERRRSPSLSMIVVVVLLGIIGYSAYHLVSTHGKKAVASTVSHPTPHASVLRTTPKPSPSPTPTVVTDAVVIRLTAVQNCWVLLTRSSSGSQIYMGEIPAGRTVRWTEKEAVRLELGNPPGVVLTVNGKRQHTDTPQVLTLNLRPPSR